MECNFARRRGARRLDYRHQGVRRGGARRGVRGSSRCRRSNRQQLHRVARRRARDGPDAHTRHGDGRAEHADSDGKHATVFARIADEHLPLWW